MSEKKDDHKEEKKSFPATLFGVAVILVAVWIFLIFVDIPLSGAIKATATLFGNIGREFMGLTQETNVLSHGINAWIFALIKWLAPVIFIGAIVWGIRDDNKKKKASAHPPADALPPAGGGH